MGKLLNRKEIQERLTLSKSSVSTYVKRGKLVPNEDGLFDMDFAPNALFESERRRKQIEGKVKSNDAINAGNLVEEKTKAEIERIKTATILNELKIEKQKGETIPTEMVAPVVNQLAQELMSEFLATIEKIIVDIGHIKKLNNAEMADIRRQVKSSVNMANERAIKAAKKSTEMIVDEYIDKRGRGERN
jgi:hypothetical protein